MKARREFRLVLCQAQEEFVGVTFGTLGGGVAHALVSRLEFPARFCSAACGMAGFADETQDVDQPVCMRCVRTLRKVSVAVRSGGADK